MICRVLESGRDRFPHAIAVCQGDYRLTYRQLHDDVEAIASHLADLGVRPGAWVACDINRPISHWLVLLALMRIGAVSVSWTVEAAAEAAALPAVTTVISSADDARTYPEHVTRLRVGRDWRHAHAAPRHPVPSPAEAEAGVGRICFTSGTSGLPKAILLGPDLLAARLAGTARRNLINARSVLWCGLGPDTAYGFTATVAAWREGATVLMSRGGEGAYRYMTDRHLNLVIASPAGLYGLCRDAAAAQLPPFEGTVIAAGGRLTPALRDAVRARLCTDVRIAFGASETGGVTLGASDALDREPGHVGQVFPDVEAVVVDADGRPLPPDTPGRLRVRTSSTVSGYLNDPAATAAHLDGGWFQSGDSARIAADRTLVMLGRPADVLDLGGVKMRADEIDSVARGHPEVTDAAAVLLGPESAAPMLAVVVTGPVTRPDDIAALIRPKLPPAVRFVLVAAGSIPRGSMGKVNRRELAGQITAQLADGQGARLLGRY